MAKISIIMPVYNCARFLDEAITSVLNQTFTDFECIIIDDGSTDNSFEIVKKYPDSRIKTFKRNHAGLVQQLNFGIGESNAEYIARFDADDIMSKRRLAIQYNFLQQNENIGLVGSWYNVIDADGKKIKTIYLPVTDVGIRRDFPVYCPIAHPTILIRKVLLQKINGYREQYFPVEDFDLFARALRYSNVANIGDTLIDKRVHSTTVTQNYVKQTKKMHLTVAKEYLYSLSTTSKTVDDVSLIKLAKCEYYYGSIKRARLLLFKLIKKREINVEIMRYYLPTLLGEKILQWIKRKNILQKILILLHIPLRNRKYYI